METATQPLVALNINLAGHDATYPIAPPMDYPLQIKGLAVEENKDKTGKNLVLEFVSINPGTSTRGKAMAPGDLKLKKWYPLQASEKQIAEGKHDSWKNGLCNLIDAVFGTSETDRPDLTPEIAAQIPGKVVLGSVTIENDPQFGEQNRLGKIVHLK